MTRVVGHVILARAAMLTRVGAALINLHVAQVPAVARGTATLVVIQAVLAVTIATVDAQTVVDVLLALVSTVTCNRHHVTSHRVTSIDE